MQPADLRIDPFTWIPASARRRGASTLGMMLLAASCIAAGILIGRLTAGKSDVAEAPRQTVSAVPTAKDISSPRSQAGSASQQRPSQPSLALEGNRERPEQSPLREAREGEPKQETLPVVLLNPGTAEPNALARPPRELGDNNRSRIQKETARQRDDVYRGEGQRFGRSAPDYRALRDYMLGR
jgi:hypothetical protein